MAAEPKWRTVLEDLEDRIRRGEIADRFPTDRELVEHYEVSRHTVREAVRHLRARGIIERERGRGSTVTSPALSPRGALYSLFRDVEQAGLTQRSDVLAKDMRTDERAAALFGCEPDEPLFHLERIRHAADEPLAIDTVWLPPDLGRPLLEADFTRTSLYDELERRVGVRLTGGHETITALAPDADLVEVLNLDIDEACLSVRRVGELDGRVVECRVTIVRGSRFALEADWSSSTAHVPHLRVAHTDVDA